MTCDEFLRTLQHQIDQRQSLDGDDLLQSHASQCRSCHQRLVAWQQIASVLRCGEPRGDALIGAANANVDGRESFLGEAEPRVWPSRTTAAMVLVAAAVMVIAFRWPSAPSTTPVAESSIASSAVPSSGEVPSSENTLSMLTSEKILAAENLAVESLAVKRLGGEGPANGMRGNPVAWFHSVQPQNWLGQTMPTVESFREGVAPIGRSLLRAVTILTTAGKDQPS
ncbi:hypothetical protein [Novipirellula caenicola]|uniref:Zinc-finger domain-containing protein n=1 Tax=Novipirellula caenicola TaxID=1536901 RepID=A0ABP9VSD3_9BACT